MCKFIGIESIAANALIELIKSDVNNRKLSFAKLSDYGMAVAGGLEKETKERYVLIYKENALANFAINYSDYFVITVVDGENYLCVKEGITVPDLSEMFRWSLALEVLRVFSNKTFKQIILG